MQRKRKIIVGSLLIGLAGSLVAMTQKESTPALNPALRFDAVAKPPSDVAAILHRACYDCHSTETRWPWYSHIPPVSWMIHSDVEHAQAVLNFSRWGAGAGSSPAHAAAMLSAVCAAVESGIMPKHDYLTMHPDARLSTSERERLCEWTFEQSHAFAFPRGQ